MATREVLTQAQREYFYELSDQMSERERIRYYTLSEADIQIIRQQRGATNQLGFAVQLAYLRFPGRPFASGEKYPIFLFRYLQKIRNRACGYTSLCENSRYNKARTHQQNSKTFWIPCFYLTRISRVSKLASSNCYGNR